METIKKFVVIGPESTGKSTLCSQLADHFNTRWVKEYAREYLEKNGVNYSYDDLLVIAKGQIRLEEKGISEEGIRKKGVGDEVPGKETSSEEDFRYEVKGKENRLIINKLSPDTSYPIPHTPSSKLIAEGCTFIDTDMYVMKVWCEYVFNKCHNWILNRIAERKYDGYLLCNPDLPWTHDPLREYPDTATRNKLYHFYKDILVNQQVPWIDIRGDFSERFTKAVAFVGTILL